MTRWWCTYCDVGLAREGQRDAHEDAGHTCHEVRCLPPNEDYRYQQYKEVDDDE